MNFPVVAKEVPLADSLTGSASQTVTVPSYLRDVYTWAYLNPKNVALLDHPAVVDLLLFGNARRLMRTVLAEIEPGSKALMAAHVYGDFVNRLAGRVGPTGELDIIDIAPIQVANCRRKVGHLPHVSVHLADAAEPGGGPYDVVVCFFLLHEVPDGKKRAIVDALLGSVAPGGKVVFVDYHRPHILHPIRYILSVVNRLLEPFANALWHHDIAAFASDAEGFTWSQRPFFGGVYQKVVARREA